MRLLSALFSTLCMLCLCNGAKILVVFNLEGYSHYILGHTLAVELANKGHQVTLVRSNEKDVSHPNLKIVQMEGVMDEYKEKMKDVKFTPEDMLNFSPLSMIFFISEFGTYISDLTINHKNVQKMLQEESHFDLVIVENFYSDSLRGFCYHYKAPCISFSTVGASSINNYIVANPAPSSYIGSVFLGYSSDMSLLERMHNFLYETVVSVINHVYYRPKHNEIIQKYFPNAPHIDEITASLAFLNSHCSVSSPVPHVTNMIEVGGIHIKPSAKLPEDIQKFIDDAKDGVVLFSLGSNLKSNELPIEKRDGILKALSKLKQRVLWKFEGEGFSEIPKNVKISKWLPQQDILAHPNVKLFISHGGLLSLTESIYYGVPLIGVPFFGDQPMNMAEIVRIGAGLQIKYQDLNEKSLSHALNEVLSNPSYTETAKRRSAIMRDRPMAPLDSAVYWSEYLLRHKSGSHMSSAALRLTWYQHYNLDVILLLMLIVCTPLLIIAKICCKFCKCKKQACVNEKLKKN